MPQAEITLNTKEAADCLDIEQNSVCKGCRDGRYPGADNSIDGWLIPINSLPAPAQARYWSSRIGQGDEQADIPPDQAETLWKRYESAPSKLKKRAEATFAALRDLERLQRDGLAMIGPGGILERIQAERGIGKTALYAARNAVARFPQSCWLPLLVPAYVGGNAKTVEFTPAAWDYFLRHAVTPAAKIKTSWRRTQREGEKQGWSVPSYDTAKARYDALPRDVITLVKEGPTALKRLSPTQRRDYLSIGLHEIWSTDSRIFDVWVLDTDGEVGRKGRDPFRPQVNAYMDVRSRFLLGYSVGADNNADLVRAGTLNALQTTNFIRPRNMAPDNGMENAAKEITGGAAWRRRGKVKEGEIIGMWPYMGIEVIWATPGHGQAKPIERLFRTLALMFETRPEFRSAYCGNKPDKRPEEWDKSKAVPLKLFRKILAEEAAAYNRQPHTGHGMDGKIPLQVYEELISQPGAVFQYVTPAQRVVLAYSAVEITIRKDGSFSILGSNYRSNQTASLTPGRGYYARYNPNDLGAPVYVYRGEKLVAEAERINLSGFNDKAAAKSGAKARASYMKSVKQMANALLNLGNTEPAEHIRKLAAKISPELVDKDTAEILPNATVVAINQARGEGIPAPKAERQETEQERLKRMGADLDARKRDAEKENRRPTVARTAAMGTR